MKKALVEKVIENKIYDTNRYRYCYEELRGVITRLPIEYVNTTKSLDADNYKIVYDLKKGGEINNDTQ